MEVEKKNAQVENFILCISLRRNLKTPNLLKDPVLYYTIPIQNDWNCMMMNIEYDRMKHFKFCNVRLNDLFYLNRQI